jgi:hypothetical protein
MFAFLGPLLGGLAGLLFPGAAAGAAGVAAGGAAATGLGALLSKAAIPALGAGLGTLVTGGSGKDAIRNALLMGGATALFPGAAAKIQGSEFGKNITGGLASIFGGGPEAAAAAPGPVPSPAPKPVAAPGEAPPRSEIFEMGSMSPRLGPSGMEEERAGSQPPVSGLPSLSEMADMSAATRMGRAAGGFDTFSTLPPIAALPPIPTEPVDFMLGSEGFERRAYRTPFDLDLMPGQNTIEGALNSARAGGFENTGSALDYLLADTARRSAAGLPLGLDDPKRAVGRFLPGGIPRYAEGGEIAGPGTGKSDSIPATIYQDGKPVQKAALSDGEFVMTADAVKGAGRGSRERGISRMYELMRRFERGEMA